ncbi:MAG: hypothetical protein QM820_23265 [Minicystis sp.]
MGKMDWRTRIEPAVAELRRLRALGLSLHDALDCMGGREFTLPAVQAAIIEVEGMDPARIPRLFDERGDWDDF